jgi:outer membrane protein OmpA-like peptidoglycan-associated protein
MNATVALLLIIPLLLLDRRSPSPETARSQELPATTTGESNDQPPIIELTEAAGYSFPSGTSEISAPFARLLRDVVAPKVREIAERYKCDTVEVGGHTDSRRVKTRSNLDILLPQRVEGARSSLRPGSNADLGLLRAWAVIDILQDDPRLVGRRFHGYSAGQMILPDGRLAGDEQPLGGTDVPERRRIEIRVRRSSRHGYGIPGRTSCEKLLAGFFAVWVWSAVSV